MIAQSLLPVDVSYRGRTHPVRPPTVGTALLVVAALPGAWAEATGPPAKDAPGDGDLALLRDATRGWLPGPLHRALFPSPARALGRRLKRLWDGTHPDGPVVGLAAVGGLVRPPRPPRRGGDPDAGPADGPDPDGPGTADGPPDLDELQRTADRDWALSLATYCNAYAVSPTDALGHPWPLFLAALGPVDALHAREQLRLVEARTVGKLETEEANADLVAGLMRRAWAGDPGADDGPAAGAPARMTPEEQAAQIARLRLLMGGGPSAVPSALPTTAPAQA